MSRRRFDPARVGALAGRPGVDPTVWLSLAQVTVVHVDTTHGPFVDVTYVPSGETDTALVGSPYAGASFGLWCPLAVGDVVLVARPLGESAAGPVVIARMWSQADPPPAAMAADADGTATGNVVLRVQPGASLNVTVTGGGDVTLVVESGKVYLGAADGTEPVALGATTKGYLDALKTWLDGHAHPDPVTGTTGVPTALSPAVPDVRATKAEVV